MKKNLWALVAIITVVVVGGAVYFGNSETQKGSLTVDSTIRCGTSWTRIAAMNSSGFTAGTFDKLYSTVRKGCDTKVNINVQDSDQFYSMYCADVYTGGDSPRFFKCISGESGHAREFNYGVSSTGTPILEFNEYTDRSSTSKSPIAINYAEVFSR